MMKLIPYVVIIFIATSAEAQTDQKLDNAMAECSKHLTVLNPNLKTKNVYMDGWEKCLIVRDMWNEIFAQKKAEKAQAESAAKALIDEITSPNAR